ncbi:DUF2913 family protein [uncultured Ferrimonas sp.]|uniref:DUF2913 family protein n=1 Tax=uncultured Ferrimonas sp. TaxID=432640 RepID=UPI0026296A54|nr:DUF2913 family protein [uncultured Ferrimonas sp.]
MATGFNLAIAALAQTGLDELEQGKQSGKVPRNPTSEAHYFSAWVTRAIKQHRFPHCVAKQLFAWQKTARTQGANAGLKVLFEQIVATYAPLLDDAAQMRATGADQFERVFAALEQNHWYVERDYPVTRKVSHHTDGQNSVVICSEQWAQGLNEHGVQIKPISVYARGDIKQLLQLAYQQQLLLHKVTDYKSLVKYHGEYIIYPANGGPTLAELLPLS